MAKWFYETELRGIYLYHWRIEVLQKSPAFFVNFSSENWEKKICNKKNIIWTIVRYERVKKKGYVRLTTNMGPLNFELHCEYAPKTCENFIKLCQKGYYDGTKFHRSIRHFMIQGGDPLGTGNEVYQEIYFIIFLDFLQIQVKKVKEKTFRTNFSLKNGI